MHNSVSQRNRFPSPSNPYRRMSNRADVIVPHHAEVQEVQPHFHERGVLGERGDDFVEKIGPHSRPHSSGPLPEATLKFSKFWQIARCDTLLDFDQNNINICQI